MQRSAVTARFIAGSGGRLVLIYNLSLEMDHPEAFAKVWEPHRKLLTEILTACSQAGQIRNDLTLAAIDVTVGLHIDVSWAVQRVARGDGRNSPDRRGCVVLVSPSDPPFGGSARRRFAHRAFDQYLALHRDST